MQTIRFADSVEQWEVWRDLLVENEPVEVKVGSKELRFAVHQIERHVIAPGDPPYFEITLVLLEDGYTKCKRATIMHAEELARERSDYETAAPVRRASVVVADLALIPRTDRGTTASQTKARRGSRTKRPRGGKR